MNYVFIRPLSNGQAYPTGIIDVDSNSIILRDGASLIEIMEFLKITTDAKIPSFEIKLTKENKAKFLEVLVAVQEALNDGCIADAQMIIKTAIESTTGKKIKEVR